MAHIKMIRVPELQALEESPPKSLSKVYKLIRKCMQKITNQLDYIEDIFYGGKTAFQEIAKWSECIKLAMDALCITQLNCVEDFELTMRQRSETMDHDHIYDINKLWNCYFKVREYIPKRFKEITNQLTLIYQLLEKYFVSFYKDESDVYLETAAHYERARGEWKGVIQEFLKRLVTIPEKFENDMVFPNDLSKYAIDLLKKCRLNKALFIVLVPEICWNARKCCVAIEEWIKLDSSYTSFIVNDMKNLEDVRAVLLGKVRDMQDKYHQMRFRYSQMSRECEHLEKQLNKISDTEGDLLEKASLLGSENNDLQIEIEIKEFRREDLIKKASTMHPQLLYERYNELSASIRDMKRKLPVVQRELAGLNRKIAAINDMKARKLKKSRQLQELKKDLDKNLTKQQKAEYEIAKTEETLQVAKKIYSYKKSPDTLHKLYDKQLVQVIWTAEETTEEDPLDVACEVVAENIEIDWPKLYQSLPFKPCRGERIIDADILNLNETCNRESSELLARRSLVRWRRFHHRASLDDLLNALTKINRRDVLALVDEKLNPPEEEAETEEPIPSFLNPELIPCYRQVERYQALLQSQKI